MPFPGFRRNVALVIGIDSYREGIPKLKTATHDAETIANVLRELHGFEVRKLLGVDAIRDGIRSAMTDLQFELAGEDRVFVYFAGHGLALDGEGGYRGFLVPQDAERHAVDTLVSMTDFYDDLRRLPCRHLLLILDCCFAGAFRWSSTRHLEPAPERLHLERFNWLVSGRAWQAIASAAHDQKALDVLDGEPIGERGGAGSHSPFAAALIDGLRGQADRSGVTVPADGIITATELFLFLEDRLAPSGGPFVGSQTPVFWPLPEHGRGEFVFLTPGAEVSLAPAPPIDPEANPWLGLLTYTERDADRFFGRGQAADALLTEVLAKPLVVVTGPSGIGKSSLILAGLVPRLPADLVPVVMRPGIEPFAALADALRLDCNWARVLEHDPAALTRLLSKREDTTSLLLVVDQAEELITRQGSSAGRRRFLAMLELALRRWPGRFRSVMSIRSDFEPQLADSELRKLWTTGRFFVQPMRREELRRVVEGPAAVRVLRFETQELVDRLVDEVIQMPGALPLLSFALSEMYLHFVRRAFGDRTLTSADLDALGSGVVGALQVRADAIISNLEVEAQATARRVLERLVSVEGGEFARRRVIEKEFECEDAEETARSFRVLRTLIDARLVVSDVADGLTHVEMAHDALILGWSMFHDWLRADAISIADLRRLAQDAAVFDSSPSRKQGFLWDDSARIETIERLRSADAPGLNRSESNFADASRRRARRNRAIRSGFVAALALSTVGAIGAAVLASRARNEAEKRSLEARGAQLASEAQLRVVGQERGTPEEGLLLAAESLELNPTVAGYSAFEDALQHLPTVLKTIQVEPGVRLARFMPSVNAFLVVGSGSTASTVGGDGSQLHAFSMPGQVSDAAFDPGRHKLALASGPEVEEWDAVTGATLWQSSFGTSVLAVVYAEANGSLAVVCADGSIHFHGDGASGSVTLAAPGDPVTTVAFSEDGKRLAYGSSAASIAGPELNDLPAMQAFVNSLSPQPSRIRIVEVPSGKSVQEVALDHPPTAVGFDQGGNRLVVGMNEGTLNLLRMSEGKPDRSYLNVARRVTAVSFVDGDRFVSTASSGVVTLWSVHEEKGIVTFPHQGVVGSMQVDARNRHLLSLAADGAAYGWDLQNASSPQSKRPDAIAFRFKGSGVQCAWLDRETGSAVLAERNGKVRLVSFQHPSMAVQLRFGLSGLGNALAVSPSGKRLAGAANLMSTMLSWPDGAGPITWIGRPGPKGLPPTTWDITFSQDGGRLLTAEGDYVALRDAADLKSMQVLPQSDGGEDWHWASFADRGASVVAASPNLIEAWNIGRDGPRFGFSLPLVGVAGAIGDPDAGRMFVARSVLEVRNTADGQLEKSIDVGGRPVALRLSSSGANLIVGTSTGQVVLVRRSDWQIYARLQVQEDAIGSLDVSPDGRYLVSTSGSLDSSMRARRDQSLQISDVRTGAQLLRLNTQGPMAAARFMPDGGLAMLDNGVFKRLDWSTDALRKRACTLVGADLPAEVLNGLRLEPACSPAASHNRDPP